MLCRASAFAERIELVGYDLPSDSHKTWQPGDILPLTLFWQRLAAIDDDYSIFVHLLDGSGTLAAQTDAPPVGGLWPTSSWQEGEVIVDRHGLLLPEDLPAGVYKLQTGIYLPATGERLPVVGPGGEPPADYILLERVTVAPRD